MNWLDFVLISILIIAILFGVRVGLIHTAFNAAGVYIGWLLASQYSDDIGGIFTDSLSIDTLVTVISYGIIILVALATSNFGVKVTKPLLTGFTLGLSSMVDRIGGLALGLLMGIAISGAVIIGLSRLTYDFDTDVVMSVIPSEVAENVAQVQAQRGKVEDVRKQLETGLTESQIVPIFIDVTDAIPANALGFVPDDFNVVLDFLELSID